MENGELTAERLRELLDYNPDTGIFRWKITKKGVKVGVGGVAGGKDKDGYILIGVNRVRYKAHRLAWLHHYGVWPSKQLDHKDGVPYNNCISNLREATNQENQRNKGKYKNNKSGLKGVSWSKVARKWVSFCRVDKKTIYLGYYDTVQEAHDAYINYIGTIHNDFTHRK